MFLVLNCSCYKNKNGVGGRLLSWSRWHRKLGPGLVLLVVVCVLLSCETRCSLVHQLSSWWHKKKKEKNYDVYLVEASWSCRNATKRNVLQEQKGLNVGAR